MGKWIYSISSKVELVDPFNNVSSGSYDGTGSSANDLVMYSSVSTEVWHHIIVTYSNYGKKLFFDGILMDEYNLAPSVTGNLIDLYIGRRGEFINRFFYRELDDIGRQGKKGLGEGFIIIKDAVKYIK